DYYCTTWHNNAYIF
nr:immunoglobulin light chain junction region [Macaca mulatta]MOX33608.1 immunoglobulin light chain junction region [Macaca mulatta]